MNKYEKIYIKAAEKGGRAHWIDSAIAALAVDIEEATGKRTEISGPFGLRAEIYLRAGEDYIIITPEFPEEKIELYYDTGEFTNEYKPGTSLKAAGFTCEGRAGGLEWNGRSKPKDSEQYPHEMKQRWVKNLKNS